MTGFWRWLYNGLKHTFTLGLFLDEENRSILLSLLAVLCTVPLVLSAIAFASIGVLAGVIVCGGGAFITFAYSIYVIVEGY